MRRSFQVIVLLLMSTPAWGAIYYVDATGGNDSNTGIAINNAWQTISKVDRSSFSAGDTILFKKGETWREQLTVPSSGSAGNPITFGAYGSGAKPIINGADLITPGTSWSADGAKNVWVATGLTAEPKALTINGVRNDQKKAAKVSVATDNDWFYSSGSLYLYSATDPAIRFTSPGVEVGVRDYTVTVGKEYVTLDGIQALMGNSSGVLGMASSTTLHSVTIKNSTITGMSGILLHGSGAWGYDGVTIDNNTIVPGNYDRAMNSGLWGIRANAGGTFNNINITYNTISAAGEDGVAIAESTNTNITVSHNILGGNGENSVDFKQTNGGTISYNTCSNDGEPNIVVHQTSSNITIELNTLSGSGLITPLSDAITFGKTGQGVPGGIIRYNLITNSGRAGIGVTDSNGTKVYYNVIDGWSLKANSAGIEVGNSTGVSVYNNTLYGLTSGWRGIRLMFGSTGALVKNNIVVVGDGLVAVEVSANSQASIAADYNLYYTTSALYLWGASGYNFANWKTNSGQDAHLINAAPLFVSTSDFHLQAGSPAINAGTNVSLTTDYKGNPVPFGNAPEIGAFEYQGIPPIPSPSIPSPPSRLMVY